MSMPLFHDVVYFLNYYIDLVNFYAFVNEVVPFDSLVAIIKNLRILFAFQLLYIHKATHCKYDFAQDALNKKESRKFLYLRMDVQILNTRLH